MVDIITNALSGLQSAATRAAASASNIANMGNIGAQNPKNGPAPYTPIDVVDTTTLTGGVLSTTRPRDPASIPAEDPDHPYADPDSGMVAVPNVDLADETIRLKMAEIAYKSNEAVIRTASDMQDQLLKIIDQHA